MNVSNSELVFPVFPVFSPDVVVSGSSSPDVLPVAGETLSLYWFARLPAG